MPRVTPGQHYQRYQFLRVAWLNFPNLYAALPLREQRQLHSFYQPSKELTKPDLITHIKTITKRSPALVHQAGKHYRRLSVIHRHVTVTLGIPRSDHYKTIGQVSARINPSPAAQDGYSVLGVARPAINIELFARALIELASEQEKATIDDESP